MSEECAVEPPNPEADDRESYGMISMIMTEMGYPMNQVSARNYTNRIMKKFVEAYIREYDIVMTDARAEEIAKSPEFQSVMLGVLSVIEFDRRKLDSTR